jgi:hypothetical protein
MDRTCLKSKNTFSIPMLVTAAAILLWLPSLAGIAFAQPVMLPVVGDSVANSAPSATHCLQLKPFPFGFSPLPSLLAQNSEMQPAFSSHLFAAYVNVNGGSIGFVGAATFWKSRVGLGPGIFIYTSSLKGLFSLNASFPLNGQKSALVISYAFVPSPQPSSPPISQSMLPSLIYHPPPNSQPLTPCATYDSTVFSATGSK